MCLFFHFRQRSSKSIPHRGITIVDWFAGFHCRVERIFVRTDLCARQQRAHGAGVDFADLRGQQIRNPLGQHHGRFGLGDPALAGLGGRLDGDSMGTTRQHHLRNGGDRLGLAHR